MRFLAIYILLFASPAIANDVMVIGGEKVTDELPEVIAISNGQSRCSASIISRRAVLTAGHCVKQTGLLS